MAINFDFLKFNTVQKTPSVPHRQISFKAVSNLRADTFEKCTKADNEEPVKTFVSRGEIFDRKNNKPVKVTIMKSSGSKYETTYHFMSQNLKEEYGYVAFTLCKKPRSREFKDMVLEQELLKNYPEYGIKGARIIVDFLLNHNDTRYKGIGKLADKMAVKHCLDNNIKPVIISEADWGSHIAHYKRGKRFLPLEPESAAYQYFLRNYGTTDVNAVIEKLIKEEEKNGEKINIKQWNPIFMYLPKELAQKYAKELKSEMK